MGNIVGGLAGGVISAISGNKQAKTAQANAAEAARIAREAGQEGAAVLQPFVDPGVTANQNVLAALSGGPGSDQAFQQFLNSTGYRAQLRSGQEAITGSAAARGLLNSGATAKSLTTFGQDLAQQGFNNFLGQLGTVANRGLSAAGGAASAISGAGQQSANIVNQGGVNALGAIQTGQAGLQAGLGQAVQGVGNVITGRSGFFG